MVFLLARGRSADLPVPADDIFRSGQRAQAHRPAGVQLLRRDANLRAQPEFPAVREPRARVDVHRGGIHLAQKALRVGVIFRQDGFAVAGGIVLDLLLLWWVNIDTHTITLQPNLFFFLFCNFLTLLAIFYRYAFYTLFGVNLIYYIYGIYLFAKTP